VSAGQKLEDHAGGDDRSNTEFHEGTTVTGHHHSEPVQRVGGVCSLVNMCARSSFLAPAVLADLKRRCHKAASGS
jgi:hypothetical protein